MSSVTQRVGATGRAGRVPALAVLVLVLGPAVALGQAPPDFFEPPKVKRTLTVTRAGRPPVIDGVLDDPAWLTAASARDFVQTEPNQQAPATHASVVQVTFDDEALYVAARLEQPGGWTAFNQRDMRRDFPGNESDSFGVLLDTFGDGRNAFSFQVNPWGAQRDMQVLDDTLFEDKWDTLWRSATSRDERGWTLELAIPWKSIRYGPTGTTWGVQFSRRERGVNEDTVWSPHPRNVSDWRMPYAGALEGLEPPAPSLLSLSLRPYGTARVERAGDAPFAATPSVGGEVTWSPAASAVVDLTVNTDFAETDVDRRVVNLSRFSVFFPERRQFFLESAGVFTSGFGGFLQPFFSRTIGLDPDGGRVPILAGLRAVYRTPERTAAALVVSTLPTSAAQASLFAVARYSHNLGEQSRVGGMVVFRHDLERGDDPARTNVVPVLDGLFRSGPFTVEASGMGSVLTEGGTSTFGGLGTFAARVQGNWGNFGVNAYGVSPDFEARTGFIARANVLGAGFNGGLDFRPSWLPPAIRSIGPFVDGVALWTADTRDFQEFGLYLAPVWVLFSGGDEAWLFVEKSTQVLTEDFEPVPGVSFRPGTYDYQVAGASAFTQASRKVSFGAEASAGSFYSASVLRGFFRASVQPLPHLQLSASYGYNRFWGEGVRGDFAETHLLLVETRLALNPKLQLVGSFQRDTAGNGMVLNARLAWEFEPLSFLYLVFTDSRSAFPGPDAPVAEQKLVAKLAYTWRP